MQLKKLIVGVTAQNNAGKTEASKGYAAIDHAIHYSVRTIIRERYYELYQKELPPIDTAFAEFSQKQKRQHGEQIFIEMIVKKFMAIKGANTCIIESFRAPGEAFWLEKVLPMQYPSAKGLLIAIVAPYEQRLNRFLKGRDDELSERTKEGFDKRELLVNRGTQPWEENVETLLKLAKAKFANLDGELAKTVSEMNDYMRAFRSQHLIDQPSPLFSK